MDDYKRKLNEMERCKMAREIRVENLEHLGLMATVIDGGQQYSTYEKFAEVAGYPNAADRSYINPTVVNAYELEGKKVRVLAKGNHGTQYDTVYVCESLGGNQFLIGEDGLRGIDHMKEPEASSLSSVTNGELLAELKRRLEEGTIQQESVSPQERSIPLHSRDMAVKQAKAAIEGLKERNGYYRIPVNRATNYAVKVEFIVNREKRTVVALLRGINTNSVRGKGIAKCDPTDCFNEHIGKAIALYRALGKEVPEYLLNAPQPEGKKVGDIVTYAGKTRRLIGKFSEFIAGETAELGSVVEEYGTVIDDSARY